MAQKRNKKGKDLDVRDKRLKICLTELEYHKLQILALKEGVSMNRYMVEKIFQEEQSEAGILNQIDMG